MKIKNYLFAIITLAHLLINTSFGQAPQSFNYQAVARDASGLVLGNQAVNFRISLLQGSATGTSAYIETHAVTTNLLGLVNFAIGGGTVVSGNFATINWANSPYFAQIELDVANNGTYVVMSTTQLLSVPYAQYAEKSGNPTLHAGSGISIQNDSIVNTAQNQQVNLSGTGQTNVTGNYPNYVVNTPTIQAGNGISVAGQTVTNTAPDQTVTINGTGQSSVTGTYPSFTVNTPNYVGGTGITISGNNISAQNTNAIWNANKLQGKDIDTLTPTLGKVLQFDGSKWKPSDKLPQMTTAQREALTNLYAGMTILNTNTDCIEYYNGTKWLATCGTAGNVGSSETGGLQQGEKMIAIENPMQDTMSIFSSFAIGDNLYMISLGDIGNAFYFTKYNSISKQFSLINNLPSAFSNIYNTANRTMSISFSNKAYFVAFKTLNPNLQIDIYEYDVMSNIWSAPFTQIIPFATCENNTFCIQPDNFNYIGIGSENMRFIIKGRGLSHNCHLKYNVLSHQYAYTLNVKDVTNNTDLLSNGLQGYWKEGGFTYFSIENYGLIKYSNQLEQGSKYLFGMDFCKDWSNGSNLYGILNTNNVINYSNIFDFNTKHYLFKMSLTSGFYDLMEVNIKGKSYKYTGLSFEAGQFGDINRIHEIGGVLYLTSTYKLFKLVL